MPEKSIISILVIDDKPDFLRNTDCNIAQGYFIAKPMPADDIYAWIINWDGFNH